MRLRFLSLLLLALPAGHAAAQSPEDPAFSEEMEVREIGLLVEAPESRLKQLTLGAEDVLVTVDGLLGPATRMTSEPPEDWTVAIYVDGVLAPPETVFYAALALAKRSERLAEMGAVEVTVAAPGPHLELAPNREALRVSQALSDLSGRARLRRDSEAGQVLDASTLRRQCDRLIAWASAPRPPGPRVLFLVADGFPIAPEEQRDLEGGTATTGRMAILLETARMLAAYGWITIPLPLREVREAAAMEPSRPDSDLDRFRVDHSGGGKYSSSVPPVLPFLKRSSPFRWEAAVALQIEPDLAPLRALVAPTAGKLVGLDALLDPVLDNLEGRWQLWFQAVDPKGKPNEGRTRPVEVRLRDGTRLRTRAWLRSSTPEEAAAARVRALLLSATGRREGTLPVQIEPALGQGRLTLRLTVPPFEDAGPVAPGPVRLSWAFAAEEEDPQVRHERVAGIEQPGRGWSYTLTLPLPPGAGRLAVAVDDLARERWSGTVVRFSAPAAPENLPK